MNCPNCKTRLTCGCQKRVATNGTQCCQSCVAQVNATVTAPPVKK